MPFANQLVHTNGHIGKWVIPARAVLGDDPYFIYAQPVSRGEPNRFGHA